MCNELKSTFTGCDCSRVLEVDLCILGQQGVQCNPLGDPTLIEYDGKCFDCQEKDWKEALNAEQKDEERALELSRLQLAEDVRRRSVRNAESQADDENDEELQAALKASKEDHRILRDGFDDGELQAAIQASMTTQQPHDEDAELRRILQLSLESSREDEERRRQVHGIVGKYRLHVKYHDCGCELDIGETDIERDRSSEGLPYLVEDAAGKCPNCGGESSSVAEHLPESVANTLPCNSTDDVRRCTSRDVGGEQSYRPATQTGELSGSIRSQVSDTVVFGGDGENPPPDPVQPDPVDVSTTVRNTLQSPTIWHPDHPEELVDRPLVIVPDDNDEDGYAEGGDKEEYRKEQMYVHEEWYRRPN